MLLIRIKNDYKQAMKDKDSLKKGVFQLLISAINAGTKEKGEDLTDQEVCVIIQRELKQTNETLSLTPSDRLDLIDQSKSKIELLKEYLPSQMTIEEVKEAIIKLANDNNLELIKKNQGVIIKGMMSTYGSSTDGKMINTVLASLLTK